MVSLTFFKRRFTPNWRMAFIALLVFLFLLRLGFWQLTRAEEKNTMLKAQAALALQAPVDWRPGMNLPVQYQRLKVKGSYLAAAFLLDNQHYKHQFGYHLLSPFLLSTGEVILIDRGWLAGDQSRQRLPEFSIPSGSLQLTGDAYYPSAKSWVLGQVLEKRNENLALVERIDTKIISQFLHKSVYPFIIRLDKDDTQGYVREWAVVAMPPERHYAYALQWFAMALVVLILFIVLNLKKADENG